MIQVSVNPRGGPIKMAEVITALSEATKGTTVIVTDTEILEAQVQLLLLVY